MIPAIYHLGRVDERIYGRQISLQIAGLLFVVYVASLVYTLVTSKSVVGKAGVEAEREELALCLRSPTTRRFDGAGTRPWRSWLP